jgi:hypothetical protein
MIWFFERHGRFMRCEIRHELGGEGYELVITHPDGSICTEHYSDSTTLTKRQLSLQMELLDKGWAGPHGRDV